MNFGSPELQQKFSGGSFGIKRPEPNRPDIVQTPSFGGPTTLPNRIPEPQQQFGMSSPGLQPSAPGISQNAGMINRNPIQRQGGFNSRGGFGPGMQSPDNFNGGEIPNWTMNRAGQGGMNSPYLQTLLQSNPQLLQLLQLFGSSAGNMFGNR